MDLITGSIYAIPAEQVSRDGQTVTFRNVPVYDGPAAIADRSLLAFVAAREKVATAPVPTVPAMRTAKDAALPMAQHRLAGTQQPAPAVLICTVQGEDVSGLVRWLNSQDVHAFVVSCGGQGIADVKRALQTIRSRSAQWQVRIGSVGVLGAGKRNAEATWAAIGDADFAVLLDPDGAGMGKDAPEAQGKAAFAGGRGGYEKPLSARLEKYKGKVF